MAHFAKLDESNTVIEVLVVHNDELLVDGVDSEAKSIEFLTSLSGGHINWKQTSYNGRIRKNYAGAGFTYDLIRDAFILTKPYTSWLLDEESCRWISPVPYPNDEKMYQWDEPTTAWVVL